MIVNFILEIQITHCVLLTTRDPARKTVIDASKFTQPGTVEYQNSLSSAGYKLSFEQ